MVRILEIEQVEQVAVADAQDLRASVDAAVLAGDDHGGISVKGLAPGRFHAGRPHVCLQGGVLSLPVQHALSGDTPTPDPHLQLTQGHHVLVDGQVSGQGRDGNERRGDAAHRHEAVAREQGVLVGETQHRVRVHVDVVQQPHPALGELHVLGQRHVAIEPFDRDPRSGQLQVHVLEEKLGEGSEDHQVGRSHLEVDRDLAAALDEAGLRELGQVLLQLPPDRQAAPVVAEFEPSPGFQPSARPRIGQLQVGDVNDAVGLTTSGERPFQALDRIGQRGPLFEGADLQELFQFDVVRFPLLGDGGGGVAGHVGE
ncbi:hypothetical protein ACN28S_42255 [Cystobacter fuscus]